jgi:hypothetical protein
MRVSFDARTSTGGVTDGLDNEEVEGLLFDTKAVADAEGYQISAQQSALARRRQYEVSKKCDT